MTVDAARCLQALGEPSCSTWDGASSALLCAARGGLIPASFNFRLFSGRGSSSLSSQLPLWFHQLGDHSMRICPLESFRRLWAMLLQFTGRYSRIGTFFKEMFPRTISSLRMLLRNESPRED